MNKLRLSVGVLVFVIIGTVWGLQLYGSKQGKEILQVFVLKEDVFKKEKLQDFIYKGAPYLVKIHTIPIDDIPQGIHILVTESFIKNQPAHGVFLKKALNKDCNLVVETSLPPYVICSWLGIGVEEIEEGDLYPRFQDIGAVGFYKTGEGYHVGYAKLNQTPRYTKEYYETLLMGFLRI
jgi:hypothetical protein